MSLTSSRSALPMAAYSAAVSRVRVGRESLSRNSLQSISLFCHCAALRLQPVAMSSFLSWVICM